MKKCECCQREYKDILEFSTVKMKDFYLMSPENVPKIVVFEPDFELLARGRFNKWIEERRMKKAGIEMKLKLVPKEILRQEKIIFWQLAEDYDGEGYLHEGVVYKTKLVNGVRKMV